MPCGTNMTVSSCPVLVHSCTDPTVTTTTFTGDPAVRIHSVISAAKNHNEISICDADYSTAIDSISTHIQTRLNDSCLSGYLLQPITDESCSATDNSIDKDGHQVQTLIPMCKAGGTAYPCWQVRANMSCAAV